MAAVAVAVRCNFCSRELPAFRVAHLRIGQHICDDCLDGHMHALAVLGGEMPRGCQECGATWEQLRAQSPDIELAVKMTVVQKDGILQVLCSPCSAAYLPKRADLYRGTKFGSEELKIS